VESIFTAVPRILEQFETNTEAREAFVFAAWRRSVGELLNEHTTPVELIDERLRVAVSSLTWKRHLESMAPEILAKLSAALGRPAVVFIEFFVDETIGRIRRRPAEESKIVTVDTADDAFSELRESAEAIEDEALKEKFVLAAAHCLERKKRMETR
jgi:Dna[CI] antecedent DciA-like protein